MTKVKDILDTIRHLLCRAMYWEFDIPRFPANTIYYKEKMSMSIKVEFVVFYQAGCVACDVNFFFRRRFDIELAVPCPR